MSMNYAFGFSLFLLILGGLNIYFFYTLNTISNKSPQVLISSIQAETAPSIFKDIHDHLIYLPNQYKIKNNKFVPIQKKLLFSFNSSNFKDSNGVWQETRNWDSDESLFPHENGNPGKLLRAIQTSQIVLVDNAPKGTQLKFLLMLEGKQKIYFKPKRYSVDQVIKGNIYAGFDRHNSEVLAYYLAMILNFKWIPPSTIRKIHTVREILPVATLGLKKTSIMNENGTRCFYGKCFYCKVNETVCPDHKGEIEGAAILYLEKPLRVNESPWRRSYNRRKMEWEKDNNFCKKVFGTISEQRILNIVDVAIFDFLIQNGDRHRHETYKNKILFLDNGKGLGNPTVDELDILAPLYQCCVIGMSTWHRLEALTGGSLTETIKILSSFQGIKLTTEDHFKAIERRLLKIYATVQYCIGKHGSAKVFKNVFN